MIERVAEKHRAEVAARVEAIDAAKRLLDQVDGYSATTVQMPAAMLRELVAAAALPKITRHEGDDFGGLIIAHHVHLPRQVLTRTDVISGGIMRPNAHRRSDLPWALEAAERQARGWAAKEIISTIGWPAR